MPKDNPIDEVIKVFASKYYKELGLLLLAIVVVGGFFLSYLFSQQSVKQPIEITNSSNFGDTLASKDAVENIKPTDILKIVVDVSGAVNKAGVYELDKGSRLQRAIDMADGFSDKADLDYIAKNVNLAQKLADGEKIYIPDQEEVEQKQISTVQQSSVSSSSLEVKGVESNSKSINTSSVININTASQSQLESLSGIGPVYAQRNIEMRPFSKSVDIMRVKGIGEKTYEKIKDRIVVSD